MIQIKIDVQGDADKIRTSYVQLLHALAGGYCSFTARITDDADETRYAWSSEGDVYEGRTVGRDDDE